MTFVDTNVFMYAVGGPHPLRAPARAFLFDAVERNEPLVTSAEVLQELLHAYLAVGRQATLDAALTLVSGCVHDIWPVEAADVHLARALESEHPGLTARDLVHIACCHRRNVGRVMTYDRSLAAAMEG
ncbi:MAG: type II toxin-antitoxin system VapC family toxin [Gemmatimonadota bacterium]|nr:type II toxin-antitoxin system VapC family toxin [Gemmatimonadota bacterium]